MRSETPKAPLTLLFRNKKGLHNMRNLPETPIIFLVYSSKSFFLAFGGGGHFIAISKINYIKQCTDRNYVHKHAYLGSDWSLTKAIGS
jgi:hypothetical protein